MDLLAKTPYLLSEEKAQKVLVYVQRLQGEVDLLRRGGTLDDGTLERLRREWGVQQVYESAGIEGNQLSFSETQIAIQRGVTISGKPPEHSREVQNLHVAHEYLETLARESHPISEVEIKEIQSLIVGPGDSQSGVYRVIEVFISGSQHKPPHPVRVPELMRQWAEWLASSVDVPLLLRVAVLHAWFTHIHPFRDGNGRTARALTNLLLIRAGYPIIVIRRKDRQRYYEALRFSDDGDLTPLLELIAERSQDSLRQIDRARTAVAGISLAVEKVREQEERRYRIWLDGIRLFVSTLEDCFKQIEGADAAFRVLVQQYDQPSADDFREMCRGSSAGNTWLLRVAVSRALRSESLLLWVGYSSDELSSYLGLNYIPAIKISEANPLPPPPWIVPSGDFPSSAREFAYQNGDYYRVEEGGRITKFESVLTLASKFTSELLIGWFAADPLSPHH